MKVFGGLAEGVEAPVEACDVAAKLLPNLGFF